MTASKPPPMAADDAWPSMDDTPKDWAAGNDLWTTPDPAPKPVCSLRAAKAKPITTKLAVAEPGPRAASGEAPFSVPRARGGVQGPRAAEGHAWSSERGARQRGQGRAEERVQGRSPCGGKKRPQRVSDFLEPTTSAVKEQKFAVFDIESKSGDSRTTAGFDRPFLAQAFDPFTGATSGPLRDEPYLRNRDWRTRHMQPGGCIDKLAWYLLSEQFAGYVFYAHNGGSFDHLFLLHWLEQHRDEFRFEVIPVQSSIQVLRVWPLIENEEGETSEGPPWDFLDSMKLLPMSLAKACETFNVDTKIDHDLHRAEDDPSWDEYLFQDCKSLALVMLAFVEMIQVRLASEVGITTPSTSMKLFRRQYLGKHGTAAKIARYQHWPDCQLRGTPKNPGPCTGCAHAWIRSGYYGGRTEIFRLFALGQKYFDVNSSYVAAMRYDMPVGKRVIERGRISWFRHRSVDNPKGQYGGFAEVTVYIPPECPIPPLPHKDPETGKLRFPTGQFHGVWSVDELKLLEDPLVNGRIVDVVCTVWFRLQSCFRTMVDELWKYRNPRLPGYDGGMSAVAKLLGNGLYGKFAMKPQRTSVVFERPNATPDDDRCFLCGEPALERGSVCRGCEGSKAAMDNEDGDVWYQAKAVDAPYIIPHISAHITTLARIRLWTYMRMALRSSAGKRDGVEGLIPGEVVFPNDAGAPHRYGSDEGPVAPVPEMVVKAVGHPDAVEVTLRNLDTGSERAIVCPRGIALPAGGKVAYCDSVTGDRTTVVRTPEGRVEVVTFEELFARRVPLTPVVVPGKAPPVPDGKSRGMLPGYEVLAAGGWSAISQIIAHRSGKITHRVTTKDGQTQVTTDHGIMVKGVETTPEAFVAKGAAFTRVPVPPVVVQERVDLFEAVQHYRLAREHIKPVGREVYRFEADDTHVTMTTDWGDTRGLEAFRFRRFYDTGSAEMAALVRLVGAFVSDGSVSILGQTTMTRFMFSLCKSDLQLMEQLRDDLRLLSNAHVPEPFWTETVYVVRSGTIGMSLLFAALCGVGHLRKCLPSFCFHLGKTDADVLLGALEKGDGRVEACGAFGFTSTSQKLTAGVSLFLAQQGLEHGFTFRPSKNAWSVRTRPAGRSRKGRTIGHQVFPPKKNEWVYDLAVAGSHTFVDGIGQVLLHNTDSIITDVELPWDASVMGDLKDEYPGETLNYLAVQPKVYLIERAGFNARQAEAAALWAKAEAGQLDADTLKTVRARKAAGDAALEKQKAQEVYRSPAWWAVKNKETPKVDYWAIDPIALPPDEKVTMKGFPKKMRTKANLEILRGGPIDWTALAAGTMPPTGKKGALDWPSLERVRSVAREGFRRPPRMKEGSLPKLEIAIAAAEAAGNREEAWRLRQEAAALAKEARRYHAVSKSFQGDYDKRVVLDDGTGRTKAVVLTETVGDGFGVVDAAAEE